MAEGKPGYGEAAPGDHLQTSYNLWLVGHQLEHGRVPWRDPYSFQPEVKPRWNLAGWPFGYVYWPLQAVLGTVLAWNVFLLLGFLGAGGFTALWLREVGTPRGASLAGGLAFAMAPYLQAQWSAGHLLAWIAMLLPLSLYGLERARKGSDWWLAVAGGALVSIPLSGQLHLALGAIPFFAAYALVRLPWAALLAVPALGAGLLADALAVSGTTGASGRQFRQVEHYSATVPDFLSRDTHALEGIVYVGWTVAVLAVAGLVALILRRRWGIALVLGLGALIPILFSLGGNLPGYHFIWEHVPGLRNTRVPERMMPIACLALAGLVAVAVSRLRWSGIAVIVALLLLVDLRIGLFHQTAADPAQPRLHSAPATVAGTPARVPRLRCGQPERERLPLLPDAGAAPASVRLLDDCSTRGRPPAPRAPEDAVPLPSPDWRPRARHALRCKEPMRRTTHRPFRPDRRLPGALESPRSAS